MNLSGLHNLSATFDEAHWFSTSSSTEKKR